MKKEIAEFVRDNYPNCYVSYSGKERTMYITNRSNRDIEDGILHFWGLGLPFKLATNNG